MTNLSYTYTPFGKASLILQIREYAPDGTPLARPDTISSRRIIYGPDHQRWQTVLTDSTGVATTISYAPGCDVVQRGSVKTTSYYLEADGALVAIVKATSTYSDLFLAETDHLGSITGLVNESGTEFYTAEFDAWGQRTVTHAGTAVITPGFLPTSSSVSNYMPLRGYTGHEHYMECGLIDMNGRMYDPLTARFLSPDPFVQMPDNPQNFNRYAYCLNNPLMYTDPSGEIIWAPILIGAIIGGSTGGIIGYQKGATGWDMVGYIAGGALIGGLSSGISLGMADAGYVISGMCSGSFSGTMFSGMASGWDGDAMISGFVSGIISGGLSGCFSPLFGYDSVGMINVILADGSLGAATGFVTGGVTSILMGGDFMDGALAGMASGAITGAVIGGLRGYSNAETLGVNKITGGTLEERGQAWANYYGFEDVTIKPINNSTIEEYNEHSTTYTLSNNMGEIQATNKTTGVEFIIDGVTKINSKTIYLTKSTIRHASFNSGWGKGTFFHEYTHVINKSTDEYLPYLVGYKHGGASYYRRNEMMMKAQGINRY